MIYQIQSSDIEEKYKIMVSDIHAAAVPLFDSMVAMFNEKSKSGDYRPIKYYHNPLFKKSFYAYYAGLTLSLPKQDDYEVAALAVSMFRKELLKNYKYLYMNFDNSSSFGLYVSLTVGDTPAPDSYIY